MSEYVHKSHNVSVLLYHFVCPTKYRRIVLTEEADNALREVCEEISKRYEISFVEVGSDEDHVHFLIQSVPTYAPSKIVQIIKSITAREIFKNCPDVRKKLWGGQFWSDGYFVGSVGKHGNGKQIEAYVKKQGKAYQMIHREQLSWL